MSPLKIGRMAEEVSASQDEGRGYVCDFKPLSKWGSKDLLATDFKNGFDRVCTKPNELTIWTQCKSINKVSQEVLRDMIQWASDFTVDNVPSALVYLDVWWWNDPEGAKDKSNIVMERWNLPRMMFELANRRELARLAFERHLAKEKVLVAEMIRDVVPDPSASLLPVITREPEANLGGSDLDVPSKVITYEEELVRELVKSAEKAKASAEEGMKEGVDVMVIKGEEKEGS